MANIVIKRPRMICVLTEDEVLEMLKKSPDVWAESLRRGKGVSRFEKSMERKGTPDKRIPIL